MGLNLKKLGSRIWDQVNVLDNGRTYQNQNAQNNQGVADQATNFGRNVTRGLFNNTSKLVNTGALAGQQVYDTARMQAATMSHNAEAFRNANQASQNAYNRWGSGGGLLGAGTVFKNGQEAQSGELGTVAKRVGGSTLGAASELIPLAKGWSAGTIAAKKLAEKEALAKGEQLVATHVLPKLAATNAAIGVTGSVGNQLAQTGHIDPMQTLKDTAAAEALGLVGYGAGKMKPKVTDANKRIFSKGGDEKGNLMFGSTVERVNAKDLKLGDQTLGGYDKNIIKKYREQIKNTGQVEPLVYSVGKDGQKLLQDGKHRLAAMRQEGITGDIPVVRQYSLDSQAGSLNPAGGEKLTSGKPGAAPVGKPKVAAKEGFFEPDPKKAAQAKAEYEAMVGKRPQADLQLQIEAAHNAGNTQLARKLESQLKDAGLNPDAQLPAKPKVTAKEAQIGEALGMTKQEVAKAKAGGLPPASDPIKLAEAPVAKNPTPTVPGKITADATKSIAEKPAKAEFMDSTSRYLGAKEAGKTRNVVEVSKLPKLNEADSLALTDAIQKGAYEGSGFGAAPAQVRGILEGKFQQLKDAGVDIGHIEDYFPQKWQNATADEVAQAYQTLNMKAGIMQPRTIPTVAEGIKLGFKPVTTDYREAINNYLNTADKLLANRQYFNELKSKNLIAEAGSRPQGMQVIDAPGLPQPRPFVNPDTGVAVQGNYYAKPDVARELNKLFGSQPENKILKKTAGAAGTIQEMTLAGGLPGTPLNAFGTAQWLKHSLEGHPITATKDFFRSFSPQKALEHEKANVEFITKMQEAGVPYRGGLDARSLKSFGDVLAEQSGLGKAKTALSQGWHAAVDDATFRRFMPALQLDTFKLAYQKALKNGLDDAAATKLAAETTSHAFGLNSLAKDALKSKNASNAISTAFFAPKFRESMVNFWKDNAKALGHPTDPAYRENIKFLGGATLLFGAMQAANMALNEGKPTWKNENKNDRLNVNIPTGEGKSVVVPFLSSIATVPRVAFNAATDVLTGNPREAGLEAKKAFSQLVAPAFDILANENYRGSQVYNPKDDAATRLKDQAGYFVSRYNHPYIQAGYDAATGKSSGPLETAATALEAPLRFRNYDSSVPAGKSAESADARIKQAFNSPEAKKFLSLTDAQKKEAALSDPNAAGLYKQYQAMKTAFKTPDILPDGISPESASTIQKYNRLTASGRDKVLEKPGEKFKYEYANLEKGILDGTISPDEQYTKERGLIKYQLAKDVPTSKINDYYDQPKNDYKLSLAQYQYDKKAGKLSSAEDYKAQEGLFKKQVYSAFSKDSVDVYSMSEKRIAGYLKSNKLTKAQYDDLVALDKAAVASGLQKYSKLDGLSGGSGGGGGSGSKNPESLNPYKYAVSFKSGGSAPKVNTAVRISALKKSSVGTSASPKPKVSIKRSKV